MCVCVSEAGRERGWEGGRVRYKEKVEGRGREIGREERKRLERRRDGERDRAEQLVSIMKTCSSVCLFACVSIHHAHISPCTTLRFHLQTHSDAGKVSAVFRPPIKLILATLPLFCCPPAPAVSLYHASVCR